MPVKKKAVGHKWVYKMKFKTNESTKRYKVRLVIKGYTQKEGLDYHETFSLVVKIVSVRLLLALAVIKRWHLK